jgi:hypothetical protein
MIRFGMTRLPVTSPVDYLANRYLGLHIYLRLVLRNRIYLNLLFFGDTCSLRSFRPVAQHLHSLGRFMTIHHFYLDAFELYSFF